MVNNNIDYTSLNPSAQKGYINHNGYRVIYDPKHQKMNGRKKGDIYEQRWVWEKFHNCCLTKWAEVHHLNIRGLSILENRLDNSIDNLNAIIRSEHRRLHWLGNQLQKKDMTGRKCEICGNDKTY